MADISFTPLTHADLDLLYRWSHAPHLRRWWFKEPHEQTMDFIRADFGPAIDGHVPTRQFLIRVGGVPVGFIQTYLIEDWPDYAAQTGAPPGSAGMDLFLGDEAATGKGLGPAVIDAFIEEHIRPDPRVTQVVIGPEPANRNAIRCYEKAGFTHWRTVQITWEKQPDHLMVRTLAPDPPAQG